MCGLVICLVGWVLLTDCSCWVSVWHFKSGFCWCFLGLVVVGFWFVFVVFDCGWVLRLVCGFGGFVWVGAFAVCLVSDAVTAWIGLVASCLACWIDAAVFGFWSCGLGCLALWFLVDCALCSFV